MAEPNHIVLAVSGSIAAFKAAKLASDLVSDGMKVRPILTDGASHFVTPLTFEAITGMPAGNSVWNEQIGETRMGHIELARWADLLVVAPASANTIARLALGLADDLLGCTALSTRAPLLLAPAMETGMWLHPATQGHVDLLRARGARLVGPESGRLASGAEGVGRMAEPPVILRAIRGIVSGRRDLNGRSVLITAGPTYERIDPVRFIGNRSSGKMGYALAREAVSRGADVLLVSGPTSLDDPPGVSVVRVESAAEMEQAVLAAVASRDVVIMAAAVSDFAPAAPWDTKLKRRHHFALDLRPTSDIAAAASRAAPDAFHVGFALETEDLLTGARDKLHRKHQQLVVANRVSTSHVPFGSDTNEVTLVHADGHVELPRMSKTEVARAVWDDIVKRLERSNDTR